MMNAIKCLLKTKIDLFYQSGKRGGGVIKSFVPHEGKGGGVLPICLSGGGGGDRSRVG